MANDNPHPAALEQVVAALSDRDRAILLDLARVRVLSGDYLSRLHFHDQAPGSRERARRRVLARLVELRLAATLERRAIGGVRAGSAAHIYSLGIAGQRALPLLDADMYADQLSGRPRTPWTPGSMFLAHTLGVAQLYVLLREYERAHELTLAHFTAEPASWHPDATGGVIKPDAYVRIQRGDVEDAWWVEVDRATESIPTLTRKLLAYVEFARRGQLGPDGVTPRVLVTVPHDHRLAAVHDLVSRLPAPATELILPTLHDQAVPTMIDILRG
jgi:hypothetical protein